ncbi:MAG: hypothetical protein ACFNOL_04165, partial [Treponema maltophilum]
MRRIRGKDRLLRRVFCGSTAEASHRGSFFHARFWLPKSYPSLIIVANTALRVNKKVIESLIYAGAMDCLGKSRLAMIQNMENILDVMKKITEIKKDAASSLFGEDEDMTSGMSVSFVDTDKEFPQGEILKLEQQTVGVYLSG